ncbi:MAG: MarR family transcriptional regulator [Candidatus Phytoplasma sp.]|nr:MarR family transcriptional regulator [Phytoplasma sp.]
MEQAHLVTVLFKATKAVEEKIKNNISQYKLTITEFGVLEALYSKGALFVQELCEKILVPNSSMTYTLDKLEKKGFIRRTKDVVDKRSFQIILTNEGYFKTKEMLKKHYKFLDEILVNLTKKEKEVLRDLLKRIGKNELSI